jgi:hypothetical protein
MNLKQERPGHAWRAAEAQTREMSYAKQKLRNSRAEVKRSFLVTDLFGWVGITIISCAQWRI